MIVKALCLITVVYLHSSVAVRCRICNQALALDDCTKSVECGQGEECYMDEIVTQQLSIEYNGGCRARAVCSSAGSGISVGKRDDFVACSRCCNISVSGGLECNVKLCGIKGQTPEMVVKVLVLLTFVYFHSSDAVQCRICNQALSLDDCIRSVECPKDEECYMDEIVTAKLAIFFNGGCRAKDVCALAASSGISIGKRDSSTEYISCSRCCDTNATNGLECNAKMCGIKGYIAPIIRCTNGRISASFSTITDPHLEPKHLSVNMTYSGPCSEEKTNTKDYVTISVPFDECGTQVEVWFIPMYSIHIIYKTQIRYLPTSVSQSYTRIFKVQCELTRNISAGQSIAPTTEMNIEKAPGQFIVGLSFYKDPKFETAETEFPLEIPLGEWLGSAVQLTDVDKNLRLVVRDCFATPTNDRHHSTNYSLFSDKCVDDNTVVFFPFNDTMFGFRYQTFKFVLYPEVHIHCNALVCRKEDVDPECDRSCLATTTFATTPGAGRRHSNANHEIIEISSPAMIVYDSNHSGSVITRGDSTTTRRQVYPSSNITGSNSAVIKLSTTYSPSTPSSSKHLASAESTATHSAEGEAVISDHGSGAKATVPNIYFMWLVIIAAFIFNL